MGGGKTKLLDVDGKSEFGKLGEEVRWNILMIKNMTL